MERINRGSFPALPSFERTVAAWDPLGSPPAGMPADAINLAALGAIASTTIDSLMPPWEGWGWGFFVRSHGASAFKIGAVVTEVDVTIGTTTTPDASLLGANNINTNIGFMAFGATFNVDDVAARFTISMPAGNFSQLTEGRATIGLFIFRMQRTI